MPAALTTKTAISYALRYFEGLDTDDLANTKNRFQMLILLQGVITEIEQRNMKFMYTEDSTLTMAQGDFSVDTPEDFKDVGEEGSLWIPALNRQLVGPKHQQQIKGERFRDGDSQKEPFIFGLWGKKIQTVRVNQALALTFSYIRIPQELADATDITDAGADDSSEFLIPPQYHYDVILPGLVSRSSGVKAEIRNVNREIYGRNLAEMWKRERAGRGEIEQFPEYEGVQY